MAQNTSGGYPGGYQQGAGARRRPEQVPEINVSRVVFGRNIDPKLYSDIAEETAKAIAQGAGRDGNKPSQLRRFYDELVALQDKVRRSHERFEQHRPFIQMLKAKVAYARGRNKVDPNFVLMLGRVVDQADDPDKLKQARLFMEAFMAFYKVHGPREG
jgi:CRISPR-associated protein Csm2